MKNNPITLYCCLHASQLGWCSLVWILCSYFKFDMNWIQITSKTKNIIPVNASLKTLDTLLYMTSSEAVISMPYNITEQASSVCWQHEVYLLPLMLGDLSNPYLFLCHSCSIAMFLPFTNNQIHDPFTDGQNIYNTD